MLENITFLDLLTYIGIALAIVFGIVMFIVTVAYARKHRDRKVSYVLSEYTVGSNVASVRRRVVERPATSAEEGTVVRTYEEPAEEEDVRPDPSTYFDGTHYILSDESPIPGDTRPVGERQGDWSNYEGEFSGYYYDPLEACYFEGKAPVYIQKMYLPEPPPPIVKRVMPPCAPLTSKPKAKRAELVKKPGFDPATIYGQYVLGSEGSDYYFTLYSSKGDMLYASENYLTKDYCLEAVKRFKKHVLAGAFSVEGEAGDYHYKLVRNLNTYIGPQKSVRVDAEECIKEVKYYAQTDIVR